MMLDETFVCVFLYGIYAEGAEMHLRAQLKDRAIAKRIIEILAWLGSPESVPDVAEAMKASPDYDTFARGTKFMMTACGPIGRASMLDINSQKFDAKSKLYYAKIKSAIEAVTYQGLIEEGFKSPKSAK